MIFRKSKTARSRPKIEQRIKPVVKLKLKHSLIGVMLGLVALGLFFYSFKTLVVKKVKINNQTKDCISDSEVIESLNITGKGMLFLNMQNEINILLEKYPCIQSVEISRDFPQSLSVNILPRKAALAIEALSQPDDFEKATKLLNIWESTSSGRQVDATSSATFISTIDSNFENATTSGTFIADETGMIFAKSDDASDLPKISAYIENIAVGHRIDERIVKYIKTILVRLSGLEIKVINQKLIKETYLVLNVELPNQATKKSILVFLLDRDNQRELASLQLILQRNRIDLRSIESVDLRFDKPIVTFQKKK